MYAEKFRILLEKEKKKKKERERHRDTSFIFSRKKRVRESDFFRRLRIQIL
jgi:hypothetical protein